MNEQDLIYDWNEAPGAFDWSTVTRVELDDETLRDGLQNPSVVDPSIGDKIRLLHHMDELGIHTADVGLPGAGRTQAPIHRERSPGAHAPTRERHGHR